MLLIFSAFAKYTASQEVDDSSKMLSGVTVRAFQQKGITQATAIVKTINTSLPDNKTSFTAAFNTIAGVRMEERSPGSYRINIRGSSLRSPFGVRNVKVYWNDIPVTDPGGNTYFNQFATNNFSYGEIFKGPVSSMYGAGSGGLILLNTNIKSKPEFNVEYLHGSYQMHNIILNNNWLGNNYYSGLTLAHNQSDGYRKHTQMKKTNFSWSTNFKLYRGQQLKASVLFTDIYYQTPGALTQQEYEANPKAARPAVGIFPSAEDAKAAIFQKTLLAGVTYSNKINSLLSHSTTVYGAFAQVKNSAIRNFEKRSEPHFGGRSVWTADKKFGLNKLLQWSSGFEFQQGYFNIKVFNNKNGNADTVQTNDDVNTRLYSLFSQAIFSVSNKWFYTAGISFNKNQLNFSRLSSYPVSVQSFLYKNEIAPRLSVLRKFQKDFSLLATFSKGFSPPNIAELLPSTGIINKNLQAEHGWNYELTAKYAALHGKLNLEATAFSFDLKNALVQQRDASGADYFINAGNIHQRGIELAGNYFYLSQRKVWLDYFLVGTSYSYNNFKYGYYVKNNTDFSGNAIPGVPAGSFSVWADLMLAKGWFIKSSYYSASKIFMNDANTTAAKAYHLAGAGGGYKKQLKKIVLKIYLGVDNILNETYSLGNDINAAGGRYFNAAPARNYYAGIAFQFAKNLQ